MTEFLRIAEFHKVVAARLLDVSSSLMAEPSTHTLSREEIGLAMTMACLRMAALTIVGSGLDTKPFDGMLEAYVADLGRRNKLRKGEQGAMLS